MINKIVVSVVAGFSLLGTTLVAAQCPPNLNVEEIMSCLVAEGAGATDVPSDAITEPQAQMTPVTAPQNDQAAADNNALTTAQMSH